MPPWTLIFQGIPHIPPCMTSSLRTRNTPNGIFEKLFYYLKYPKHKGSFHYCILVHRKSNYDFPPSPGNLSDATEHNPHTLPISQVLPENAYHLGSIAFSIDVEMNRIKMLVG